MPTVIGVSFSIFNFNYLYIYLGVGWGGLVIRIHTTI